MIEAIKVTRRLDKGRLSLPRDFREAAGFDPFQEVSVALADFEGEKVFIIAKKEGGTEVKLNEVYSKPLKDVIEALELSDMKVHTDDGGNVKAIELKYTEKKADPEPKTNSWA